MTYARSMAPRAQCILLYTDTAMLTELISYCSHLGKVRLATSDALSAILRRLALCARGKAKYMQLLASLQSPNLLGCGDSQN